MSVIEPNYINTMLLAVIIVMHGFELENCVKKKSVLSAITNASKDHPHIFVLIEGRRKTSKNAAEV